MKMERLYGISELAAALGYCYATTYERVQTAEAAAQAGVAVAWYLVPTWVKPKGPQRREVFFSAAQIQAAAAQINPGGPALTE